LTEDNNHQRVERTNTMLHAACSMYDGYF
jgi:hypothetical protein